MTTTFTLLDGGMGRELMRAGAPFRQPEWSALALSEAPEARLVPGRHRPLVRGAGQGEAVRPEWTGPMGKAGDSSCIPIRDN